MRIHTKKTRRKMSEAKKGKKISEEHKRKISEGHKGIKMPPISKQHRKKLSEGNRKRYIKYPQLKYRIAKKLSGNKSHLWKGGISFEPYSIDWTETLKRAIRERDHYTCQLCGKEPAVCVHHIDYDKKNCSPNNLITLCRGDNSKVNHNRKHWTKYFKEKVGLLIKFTR